MGIFDLKPEKPPVVDVTVEGKTYFVKLISALDRDKFEQQWLAYKPKESVNGVRAFAAVFCLCDKDGNLEHNSGEGEKADPEFIKAVKHAESLPSYLISPIADKALEINKFLGKDVDELEKN